MAVCVCVAVCVWLCGAVCVRVCGCVCVCVCVGGGGGGGGGICLDTMTYDVPSQSYFPDRFQSLLVQIIRQSRTCMDGCWHNVSIDVLHGIGLETLM